MTSVPGPHPPVIQPTLPGLGQVGGRGPASGSTARRVAAQEPELASRQPVAAVLVDVPVAHLDHEFDYLVPRTMSEQAVVGARVSVRFAGRDVPGFVVARRERSDHAGVLRPLRRVVSALPVLSQPVMALADQVALYYAGTRMDVLRLAVPPRHARTEQAFLASGASGEGPDGAPGPAATVPLPLAPDPGSFAPDPSDPASTTPVVSATGSWSAYRGGQAFLERLAAGESPRAAWLALPWPPDATARAPGAPQPDDRTRPSWPRALVAASAATARSGRSTLIVVPTVGDVELVTQALNEAGVGPVARLVADDGPARRYREFLRARFGQARVVVGTRAAALAPLLDLGLAVIWDETNDLHREPRAPYPHVREVLALRAQGEHCALLVGGWSRSVHTQRLVESGWLREVVAERGVVRSATARAMTPGPRDESAAPARIPPSAFEAVRRALGSGPVLIQVPRAGYVPGLACGRCRTPARCPECTGPLVLVGPDAPIQCAWCARPQPSWKCPACGDPRVRSMQRGQERTAEELGRAFPGVVVRRSGGSRVLAEVDPAPELVVATPGAEPWVAGGYRAALLLDAGVVTAAPRLGAGEDALARWLSAAALVAPQGQVWLLGGGAPGPAGAFVRHDPAGFAARELAERIQLGLPPAITAVKITGERQAVTRFVAGVSLPEGGDVVGPVVSPHRAREAADDIETGAMALLRAPIGSHLALTRAVRDALAVRSGRKEPGTLRVEVDPTDVL